MNRFDFLRRAGRWGGLRSIPSIVAIVVAFFASSVAHGQLNGTYTIGGAAPSYATIDAAVAALKAGGVSGPVTFRIRGGTYAPPGSGYVLGTYPGMSATNTVTFKPDAGATVTISGATDSLTAIFVLDGGKYYVIDGSNTVGGTTRDMTIRQTQSTTNPAIWLKNDADFNLIKNCVLIGDGQKQNYSNADVGEGIVYIGQTNVDSGNDSNVVESNTVGDVNGTYRSNIGIGVEGTVRAVYSGNVGNKILPNEVVNFGDSNGPYSIGISLIGNEKGTLVEGNTVHMTVPAPSPYVYGILITAGSTGTPHGTVINANKVYSLTSSWQGYGSGGIGEDLWNVIATATITNNMVTMVEDGDISYSAITTAGRAATTYIHNNSIYIGGTAPNNGWRTVKGLNQSWPNTLFAKNNIINIVRTGGNSNCTGLYISDTTSVTSDYNMISVNTTGRGYLTAWVDVARFGGKQRVTFNDYRSNSSQDANSIEAKAPFADVANGDLHIDQRVIYPYDDRGTPIAEVPKDLDGDTRDLIRPDIGADEGGFNAGGIKVTYPNGGEKVGGGDTLNVRFTLNRPLEVRADVSTNGGVTWINGAPRAGTEGANTITITAPDMATTQARVRVVSTKNVYEGDSSDKNFDLVLPVLTVTAPNGGENLVPTDVVQIKWNAQYVPAGMRLRLDYSTDQGATWLPIDTNVRAVNLPQTNSYGWTVPDLPTQRAMVRVKVAEKPASDISDAVFTIMQRPSVKLGAPVAGTVLYAGEKVQVTWTSVNTSSIRLHYSTDDGATWLNVVPNGGSVAAATGRYDWTVPNTPAESVLLRITNVERGSFTDRISPLTIVNATLRILAPSGGETYEQGSPITVSWSAAHAAALRLDFSADNGVTWETVARDLDPATGSYTFTAPSTPTKFALVRLVDPARQSLADISDRHFEILPGKSIAIFTPAPGDQLTRNSQTVITWDAPRLETIDIYYSANGGNDWQIVAEGVAAVLGSYAWQTPEASTDQARIRIRETGGGTMAESGTFAIVDRAPVGIRLVAPNGGETYRIGDTMAIRWSASGISVPVSVSLSLDGGRTWERIGTAQGSDGILRWKVSGATSTNCRVQVGTGNINDASDASFEIAPKPERKLAVVYPNGGESFLPESPVQIRWTAQNIHDDVSIEFSSDGGATWVRVGTAAAPAGSFEWTTPAVETERGLIRITAGSIADVSDAHFEISRRALAPIVVLSPNGAERWRLNVIESIVWSVPSEVAAVDIEYSTDGGTKWTSIAAGVACVAGENRYDWHTPALSSDAPAVLVRVKNSADASHADISDASFSLLYIATAGSGATRIEAERIIGSFPNPFAVRTEIRWTQSAAADAELRLYERTGRLVATYDMGHREPGEQRYELRAGDLAAGAYIYELRLGERVLRSTMVVVR